MIEKPPPYVQETIAICTMLTSCPINQPTIQPFACLITIHLSPFLLTQQVFTHIASNKHSKPSTCKATRTIIKQLALAMSIQYLTSSNHKRHQVTINKSKTRKKKKFSTHSCRTRPSNPTTLCVTHGGGPRSATCSTGGG